MNCVACSSRHWRALPIPTPGRSITTSGVVIAESLEREQCMTCGLLQRKNRRFVGDSLFYEEQYQNYYERPKADQYDRARYVAMADWMKSALGDDFNPRTILDVGCGAGWSMEATQSIYPAARIEGVEPSTSNAEKARSAGFEVLTARLGNGTILSKSHDLIYSNNVLQHVTDLGGYFRDLAANLTADGRIALILPDATVPSSEMLWCDHNFSLRPDHVVTLAASAGLRTCNWQPNPPNNVLLDKQIVILSLTDNVQMKIGRDSPAPSEILFAQRTDYMSSWQRLDGELMRRTAGHKRVFNFGASMWTWLLAGYCPNYWQAVNACLVDGGNGRCLNKTVVSPADIEFSKNDCIVLGVNPANQASFEAKFRHRGIEIVSWSDLIGL